MRHPLVTILLSLCVSSIVSSQQITGIILDGKTDQPIETAAIYFDNTTIGTTSDSNGEFSLDYDETINAPLVISYLGYKTQVLDEFDTEGRLEIYMFESEDVLDEVILYAHDDWPRDLKLEEFKKAYLGETVNGKSCKILNEDALILRYDKRRKRLTATTKEPLFIRNRHLKYEIMVDLNHFEVNYSYVSNNKKRLNVSHVYYSGANYYKSMQEDPTKATLERRQKTYEGSVLHFMRVMTQKNLKKNGYQIYLGNSPVHPNRYIDIVPLEDSHTVAVRLKEPLNILYKDGRQSSVESFVDEFYVDQFGNHSPADQVRFGGDLGKQRMGDALPLDYLTDSKKRTSGL